MIDDALYAIARRDNPRRRFLVVSKVLGKHVPVAPALATLAGAAIGLRAAADGRTDAAIDALAHHDVTAAVRLLGDLEQRPARLGGEVTVIGFAETATALGHAAASALDADLYVHTTRVPVAAARSLRFLEEHSHAPDHALDVGVPFEHGTVVLVDDELTTGRTALNVIAAIQARWPRKRYVVGTIVDHLTEADRERMAQRAAELGTQVEVASLRSLGAAVREPDAGAAPGLRTVPVSGGDAPGVRELAVDAGGAPLHARAGLRPDGRAALERAAAAGAAALGDADGHARAVLGVGEFMYVPQRVAALAGGEGARTWSTTRSPILLDDRPPYPVRRGIAFPGPDFPDVTCHLYNLDPGAYDEVVVCFESPAHRARAGGLLAALAETGVAEPVALTFDGAAA